MKAHLVESPDPLRLGTDIIAACGKQVRNAQATFAVVLTGERISVVLSSLSNCPKCIRALEDKSADGPQYIYGVVEGQEAKDADAA